MATHRHTRRQHVLPRNGDAGLGRTVWDDRRRGDRRSSRRRSS
jgi:hypothetical protein